jgi:hypothetical protein
MSFMTKRIGKAAEEEEVASTEGALEGSSDPGNMECEREGHPLAKIEEVAWLTDAREKLSRAEERPWERGQPSRIEESSWTLESDAEASRTE